MLLEFGAAPFGPAQIDDGPTEVYAQALTWIPTPDDAG